MRTALGNGLAVERRAAVVLVAARPPSRVWPGCLLAVLVFRTSAPVAADGLMVVVRRRLAGVFGLAALGLPVASDRDVLGAAAILLAGLFRLLRRLRLLDRSGLCLGRASANHAGGQQGSQCRISHDGLPSSLEVSTNSPGRALFVKHPRKRQDVDHAKMDDPPSHSP